VISDVCVLLPSGELTVGYGKSPFLMGNSTISIVPFSIAMLVYQRVTSNPYLGLKPPDVAGEVCPDLRLIGMKVGDMAHVAWPICVW
jgi:hypothetical protein